MRFVEDYWKKQEKIQTGRVDGNIFLAVDEIVPNFARNELATAKFGIGDKEIKMWLQALFSFFSILLGLYSKKASYSNLFSNKNLREFWVRKHSCLKGP